MNREDAERLCAEATRAFQVGDQKFHSKPVANDIARPYYFHAFRLRDAVERAGYCTTTERNGTVKIEGAA